MITVHVCKKCGGGFFEHPRRGMCHMCYERARLAGNVPGLVDASRARAKIVELVGAGWKYNEIARAARVDRTVIAFIIAGRERITADSAFQICCVDPLRRAEYVKRIDPAVAKARGRKTAATLGHDGAVRRAHKAAATMGPEARSERSRKREAAMTPEAKSARAHKVWETRRAKAAAAAAEAEAAAQRARFERRAAEVECNVCGRVTRWHRRGMCQPCYDGRHTRLPWPAIPALTPPGPWVDDALCAQIDPDLWFPEKGGSTREAKKVCLSCPVREQCLQVALDNDERFGIWGGKSERERRRLINDRESVHPADTKESA